MKVLYIFIYILILPFFHAEHVAEYNYQLHESHLNLKFTIEKAEIDGFNFNSDCNIKKMTALCLTRYINGKSHIKINGESVEFELNDSYNDKGHLVINLSAEVTSDSVKELTIVNNCFYEFNAKFKNRIILDIAEFQKSYLLTSEKNIIYLN